MGWADIKASDPLWAPGRTFTLNVGLWTFIPLRFQELRLFAGVNAQITSSVPKHTVLSQRYKCVRTTPKVASSFWSPMIRILGSTFFWKFGSKAPLKYVRNLSLRRGPWRGLEWLKLASRCLKTLTGTSSEQQQLERGLWGFFLAMRIFWRRRRVLCQPNFGAWFLHVKFKDSSITTCTAARSREWSRSPAYSSRGSADCLHCHRFVTFCYSGKYFGSTSFSWPKPIVWNHSRHFKLAFMSRLTSPVSDTPVT